MTQSEMAEIERIDDAAARDLLMQFTSLGADCEFGLVQRRFGAEPISLLRWASVRPGVLLNLLNTEFRDFVEPSSVTLVRAPWGEYIIRDTKHGINFHTWLKACPRGEDLFLSTHLARLRFLRDKMIEDLAAGGSLFIYKTRDCSFEPIFSEIAAALNAFGPNRLVVVDVDQDHKGEVAMRAPNLLQAYLGRSGVKPGVGWDIPFDDWLEICRLAIVESAVQ